MVLLQGGGFTCTRALFNDCVRALTNQTAEIHYLVLRVTPFDILHFFFASCTGGARARRDLALGGLRAHVESGGAHRDAAAVVVRKTHGVHRRESHMM